MKEDKIVLRRWIHDRFDPHRRGFPPPLRLYRRLVCTLSVLNRMVKLVGHRCSTVIAIVECTIRQDDHWPPFWVGGVIATHPKGAGRTVARVTEVHIKQVGIRPPWMRMVHCVQLCVPRSLERFKMSATSHLVGRRLNPILKQNFRMLRIQHMRRALHGIALAGLGGGGGYGTGEEDRVFDKSAGGARMEVNAQSQCQEWPS